MSAVVDITARSSMLADYIAARLSQPFAWGEHDCVTFAVGWVEQVAGRDYLAEYRPWHSEREALRIIKRLGGLEAMFDKHLSRVTPNFAQDGDLTIIDRTVWVFSGAQVVSVGERGLVFRPRTEAACAWSC